VVNNVDVQSIFKDSAEDKSKEYKLKLESMERSKPLYDIMDKFILEKCSSLSPTIHDVNKVKYCTEMAIKLTNGTFTEKQLKEIEKEIKERLGL
jgi:hypothetical protein